MNLERRIEREAFPLQHFILGDVGKKLGRHFLSLPPSTLSYPFPIPAGASKLLPAELATSWYIYDII